MLSTLDQVLARRMWFVPGFVVWGQPGLSEIEFVTAEKVGGTTSILHGSAVPGGGSQTVLYADLTDHRGNALPANLAAPKVFVRSQGATAAFVIGTESPASFRVARDPEAAESVTADLLVIEMGD